ILTSAPNVILANAGHAASLLNGVAGVHGLPKLSAMYRLGGQVSNFDAGALGELNAIVAGDGYCLPAVGKQCVGGSTYTVDAAVSQITTQGHQEVMSKLATLLSMPVDRS